MKVKGNSITHNDGTDYLAGVTAAAAAAQTTANTGVTNAAAAQTTANTGVTNAATAQTTANTALDRVATRAPAGGVYFDSSTTARLISTLTGQSIGTEPFSVLLEFQCPSANPSSAKGLFIIGTNAASENVALCFGAYVSASGTLVINLRGAANTDFRQALIGNFVVNNAGKRVRLIITRGNTLSIYINGVLTAYTEVTNGTPPAWSSGSITSTYFSIGLSDPSEVFLGEFYRASIFNFALSQSDVDEIVRSGIPYRYRWGSYTKIIDATTLNGGFETLGAGGADVFANWVESTLGTSSVSAETGADKYAGTNSCKFTIDGTNGYADITHFGVVTKGKSYKLSFYAKVDSIAGNPVLASDHPSTIPAELTTAYTLREVTFIATETFIQIKRGSNCNSRNIWLDNVELKALGAVVDLDLATGIGFQAPDRSSNKLHGAISSSGVNHLIEVRWGQLRFRTNTNGNQQILGQNCLPTNARIAALIANPGSATPTIAVGNVSGGAQIVSSVALSAGRNDLTLVTRYTSTSNLWVNANSNDPIDWTVLYELID